MEKSKLLNCGKCPNLKCDSFMNTHIHSCSKTGNVVPHHMEGTSAIFWRVPLDCPLDNTEVEKSKVKQEQSTWTTVSVKEDK